MVVAAEDKIQNVAMRYHGRSLSEPLTIKRPKALGLVVPASAAGARRQGDQVTLPARGEERRQDFEAEEPRPLRHHRRSKLDGNRVAIKDPPEGTCSSGRKSRRM